MRYARDRDRSMGVTKRALLLYVHAPYVRTYYNQCARTHENGNTRTKLKAARDRTGRRTPVKGHGTARKLQLFIDVYCMYNSTMYIHGNYCIICRPVALYELIHYTWSMYVVWSHQLTFAEPSLTADKLVGVMELVTPGVETRRKVWGKVLWWDWFTPESYLDEVYTGYTNKPSDLADVYINSHPESSWKHLVRSLYESDEMAAAKKAKSYLEQNGRL